jgi:hypothetical protein
MFTLSEINEMINSQEEVFPFPSSNNITPDTPGSGHTPTPLQSPGTPEGSNIIGMGGGKMSKDRQKKDNHNKSKIFECFNSFDILFYFYSS